MAYSRIIMRRNAREVVFNVLYSEMFNQLDMELFDSLSAQFNLTENDVSFAKTLLENIEQNKKELDGEIGDLAVNYSFDRVYPTDRCALYIGLAEIKYSSDVPFIVAIDEAIALCKKYSTSESVSFVNGIFAEYVKRNGIS